MEDMKNGQNIGPRLHKQKMPMEKGNQKRSGNNMRIRDRGVSIVSSVKSSYLYISKPVHPTLLKSRKPNYKILF